jgi:peroxiredoxin
VSKGPRTEKERGDRAGSSSSDQLPLVGNAKTDTLPVQPASAEFDVPLADSDDVRKPSAKPGGAGASKQKDAAKSKRTSTAEFNAVLSADDDPLDRPSATSSAKSSVAPLKKERRSAVWKQMEEAETAEFEAMLSDTEEDPDECTAELPLTWGSDDASGSRRGAEAEATRFDAMLVDTDAEQNEVSEERPLKPERRKKASKSKGAAESDADEFDVALDDSVLDDDFGTDSPPLPPARGAFNNRRSNSTQRKSLIIGAIAGGVILMGLLLYSVSSIARAHTPPPLSDAPAGESSAAADEQPSRAESKAAKAVEPDSANSESKPANSESKPAQSEPKPVQSEAKEVSGLETQADHATNAPLALAKSKSDGGNSRADAAKVAATGEGPVLGRTIPAFSATAVDNTTFQSADHKEKVLVVAFLGVECPLANLYYPRLVELAKKYKGKSVGFLVVNSNAQDTLDDVHKQARTNRATFPVLKDAGNAVAKLFSAERTPEVFVLDAERTVRYHGMVDDQYGYRQRRSQPTKTSVIDAVDALLSGGTISVAETPVQGCHIGRTTKPSEAATTSFYRDVLPVLQNRCQQCHRKGEIGPFALKNYAEVRDWGPTIREAVAERRMPPWPADPHFGKFSNDMSLSDAEIETITKWVDDGCPEGNATDKPPEKKFVDGWNIGKPDKVYTMQQPYHVPATGVIEYQNLIVSSVFTQDTWVQAVECRFGNRSVVHHMLVLLDFPKDHSKSQDGLVKGFFAAGAPGSTYFVFPKGYAKRIPKGARLRFQMHYTPNGSPADDQSRFGIVLAKGPGLREVQTYALGTLDINIPAGAADHRESATQNVNGDVILTTLMPHLHVRGKSFTFTVVWPDGKKQTLLSVPRWDFNWQPQYQLAEPLVLPKDSKIIVEAHWDNSADNPNNILPPVDVGFGEQTFDEMFIGYVNFIPKSLADATRSHGSRKRGG